MSTSTTSAPSAPSALTAPASSLPREGVLIALLSLTVTLVVMNTTMFNVALPQVAKELALSSTAASWIVTGYSIVFAIFSITYSRLSDFLPIRLLLTIGLLCLAAASVLGFFSHSFVPLLISRLLQAAGACSVPGLGIVLVTRYIPAARRGKAMSVIISSASLGFGLGPVIGGAATQYWGWNYLFAVTGIVLLLLPLFYRCIPAGAPQKVQFDLGGAVLIGIGTTGLLLFLTTYSLPALAAGAVALAVFWRRIHRTPHPFVQPALFRSKSYMTLSAIAFASYVAQFTTLFLMPMILIRLFGKSTSETGLLIFPGAILALVASGAIGRLLDRLGNAAVIRWGSGLLLVSAVLFACFGTVYAYAISAMFILLSIGFTMLTSSVSNEMSRILPKELIGAGMGLAQLSQFFGGAFGVTLAGIALVWQKQLALATAYSNMFWAMSALLLAALACSLRYKAEAPT